jgi:nucleoside-diphosphate-sugar epimerase
MGKNSVLNGKRVLVTGASGFVGSNLCERLLMENAIVIAFVNKSLLNKPLNIINLEKKLQIVYGDIQNIHNLYDSVQNIDVIFHLAAQSHVPTSVKDPIDTFIINAIGTLNCLEAARKDDVDLFINSGSDKICGDPVYLPLDENHPLHPHGPYDASKVAGEALCMAYYKTYGLKVCLPRFSNMYGPKQDQRKVIPNFINQLLQNKPPIIRTDGTLIRDYLYIGDAIEAFLKMIEHPTAVGEPILCGTGKGTTVLDLCKLLIEVSGTNQKPVVLNHPTTGEILSQYLDISKAKQLLNWSPKISLRKGLSLTWEWYKSHPDFYWGLN